MESARLWPRAGAPLAEAFGALVAGLSALDASPDPLARTDNPLAAANLRDLSLDWISWATFYGTRLNPYEGRAETEPSRTQLCIQATCGSLILQHRASLCAGEDCGDAARAAEWRTARDALDAEWARAVGAWCASEARRAPWRMVGRDVPPSHWSATTCIAALQLMCEELQRLELARFLAAAGARRVLVQRLNQRLGELFSCGAEEGTFGDPLYRTAMAGGGPPPALWRASAELRHIVTIYVLARSRSWCMALGRPSNPVHWPRADICRLVAEPLRQSVMSGGAGAGSGGEGDALAWLGRRMRRMMREWLCKGETSEMLAKQGLLAYTRSVASWPSRKWSRFMAPIRRGTSDSVALANHAGLVADVNGWIDRVIIGPKRWSALADDDDVGPSASGHRRALWHMLMLKLGHGQNKPHAAAASCWLSAEAAPKHRSAVARARHLPVMRECAGSWAVMWRGRVACPSFGAGAQGQGQRIISVWEALGLWFTLALRPEWDPVSQPWEVPHGAAPHDVALLAADRDRGVHISALTGDADPTPVGLAFQVWPGAPWTGYNRALDGA